MSDAAAPVAVPHVPCPRCGSRIDDVGGPWTCRACGTSGELALFEPPVALVTVEAGEGRCATHPGKDAVDSCARCGAFVCGVCRTRTGDRTLCPACFDVLHDRGELAATSHRRRRWDHVATSSLVYGFLGGMFLFVPYVLVPFAWGAAVYALVCRRTQPWVRVGGPLLVLATLVVPVLLIVLAVVLGGMG